MAVKRWEFDTQLGTAWTPSSAPSLEKYRAVCLALHDGLVAVGLRWVADKARDAQADLENLQSVPAVDNHSRLWRLYELNDSLSGELPIYLKVFFAVVGSTSTSQTVRAFAADVQTGTQFDELTWELGGLASGRRSWFIPSSSLGFVPPISSTNMMSKGEGYACVSFGMFATSGSADYNRPSLFFALERTQDDRGAYTLEGYTLALNYLGALNDSSGNRKALQLRTVTYANTEQPWSTSQAPIVNPGYTGTVEGAVQLQRLYHVTPTVRPMTCLAAYYLPLLNNGRRVKVSLAAGREVEYAAMTSSNGVSCGVGGVPDARDTTWGVAMLWEP